MKLGFCFLLFFVALNSVKGQSVISDSTKDKTKNHYFFSIQYGALIKNQVTFSAATIHGITLGKKLRIGGGVGFDSFKDVNTMPVFGSASFDLFGKRNAAFVQATYGWASFAWSPYRKNDYGFKEAKGGEDISLMLGYRISSGDVRIAFLAGLKRQEVQIKSQYPVYYPWSWPSLPKGQEYNTAVLEQTMNRFVVSLSVGWK